MGQKKIPQRYPVQDFSGGTVTDRTVKLNGNELLQATNVILNPGGDFEKRKGTELLTSSGVSVHPKDDIYGIVWYAYDSSNTCWRVGYAFESTKGALDTIILIDYGSGSAAITSCQAAYDAWLTAATAGSYNTNYTYAWGSDCG